MLCLWGLASSAAGSTREEEEDSAKSGGIIFGTGLVNKASASPLDRSDLLSLFKDIYTCTRGLLSVCAMHFSHGYVVARCPVD